jgi:hypothetical protein
MAHTIQDMSELQAAQAILEDVNIVLNLLTREALSSLAYGDVTIGTLLDNIEEAAERIIDLNHDEDRRLNPKK